MHYNCVECKIQLTFVVGERERNSCWSVGYVLVCKWAVVLETISSWSLGLFMCLMHSISSGLII